MKASLRSALSLFVRRAGWLLHPPGSSAYLALILAIGGFEVGFNSPGLVAETLAVRLAFMDGPGAFLGALRALPDPSRHAIATTVMLALACLFTLGGWIHVGLTVVRGQEPTPETWHQGLARSGRALAWMGLVVGILALGLGAVSVLTLGIVRAYLNGTLGEGSRALYLLAGSILAFFLSAMAALHVLGTTYLLGIVAVAEPQTRFLEIPRRSRQIFVAARGERFMARAVAAIFGWVVFKAAMMQVTIPFVALPSALVRAYSVFGSVTAGALMLGDGVLWLVLILLASGFYQEGVERLAAQQVAVVDPPVA